MPKGRPPLSEDVVHERVADYCARYGVRERNADGFPIYPTGQRESRQHREWVVLYKTFNRMRGRQGARPLRENRSGQRVCAICLKELASDDEKSSPPGLHAECSEVVQFVMRLGPAVLDRIRGLLK
jgi:hypothetical protein